MLPAFLSNLTISWFSPLLKKGWRKSLEVGDLLPLPQHLGCESAYHAFLRGLSALPTPPSHATKSLNANVSATAVPGAAESYSQDCAGTAAGGNGHSPGHSQAHTGRQAGHGPSPEQHLCSNLALLRLIWLLHGPALRRALLLIYSYQVFVFFQPVLLNDLANHLTHGRSGDKRIWILPVLLFVSPLLGSLCKVQAQLAMIQVQIALRSQLTAAVYRKCLRLSASARASLSSGRVVNLMSADVAKICDFLYPQLAFMSVAPLAVVVSLTMLWFQIGWATLIGLAVLLLSSPVSNIAVRATQRHRNEMLKAADSRMKLVGQFLAGVRVIKMYHWERPQADSITKCREEELRALRNMIPSKVAMQTLLYVLPQLAGVLSFLVVGLTQPQALTAGRAFSSLVLFQIMRFPLLTLSTGLVELGAAIISARRITSFMAAEEQRDYVTRLTQPLGTTPVSPPRCQRDSLSVYDMRSNSAAGPSTTPIAQDCGLDHQRESTLSQGLGSLAGAEVSADCKMALAAGDLSVPASTSGGSSSSRLSSMSPPAVSSRAGLHTATMGIEPGLTIRATGFHWAACVTTKQQEEQNETGTQATAAGPTGKHSSAIRATSSPRRCLTFHRRTESRPFMEVVDAAGEYLGSSAEALRVRLRARLTHALTRLQRDMDRTYESSCNSMSITSKHAAAAGSGVGGVGNGAAFLTTEAPTASAQAQVTGTHEEQVGLLHDAEDMMDSRSVKRLNHNKDKLVEGDVNADDGIGCPHTSVTVAFDSPSEARGGNDGKISWTGDAQTGSSFPCLKDVAIRASLSSSSTSTYAAGSTGGFMLGSLDLRVRPGELVCVVGPVGSGKSSLLSAALGEMELVEELNLERGDVVGLGGRVAYVAQQAWIINATLLENVTMGRPLDEEKWGRCIEACALGPDLELLPVGRDTEIGEKGLNLSGGQKQRLSLARAMYQEADIYLLDDPLSAVDVHVGAHIFNHMIRGAIASAAVLLVTNALQYLPAANSIVVLNSGKIVAQGTYKDCLEEPLFRSLLTEFQSDQQQQGLGLEDAAPLNQQQMGVDVAAQERPQLPTCNRRINELQIRSIEAVRWHQGQDSTAVAQAGGDTDDLVCRGELPANVEMDAHEHLSCRSHSVPTLLAYENRRSSVELVQQQQELRGKCTPSHLADLDEGNEMMDSLLRMSVDGGAPSESDSPNSRGGYTAGSGHNGARTVDRGPIAALYNNNNNNNNGVDMVLDERRPLLSTTSVVGCSSEAVTCGPVAAAGYPNSNKKDSCNRNTRCRNNISSNGNGSLVSCLKPCFGTTTPHPAAASHDTTTVTGKKGRITVTEDRELGQVKWKVYGAYMEAFHVAAAVAMVLFWAAEQGTRLATNAWLARWSRSIQQQINTSKAGGIGLGHFAVVYVLLAGVYAFATFCRSTTNNLGSYRASKILHVRTLSSLMAAPLVFFEATPVGRILNRLSRDVDEMDYNLAMYQQQLGNCVMRLLATIIFLCVLQPAFIVIVVPLAVIYFILQKYFRRSSIELQRIDSVTRSPVYANFAETMSGLDTIRAYHMQERFKERHEAMVDTNATAYYNARVADEWLSLRLDLIGSIIVLSVALLNVGFTSVNSISPALVALALAEAIDLTSFLNYAVKVSALVESRYNAVERLLTYAQLEPEETMEAAVKGPPPILSPGLPPWPATGDLEFCDVWMSYRPGLDPVLQGVTFKVHDGEKVGIVGRTGSGKSSLVVALFRLVEPQQGRILLDGVDLRTLGLGPARTALSAIPQEPVLFSGSVRSNLDPWGHHSDSELWAALGIVALHEYVQSIGGLSAVIAEGGNNFSVGQRQLVCVARALLRRPRLLVADEATASVDPVTDAIIQRALRIHFKESTVLSIAHRLNTILDSDAVVLMDAGQVAEFGPITKLLANPRSAFTMMVHNAGLLNTAPAPSCSSIS
ncbi:hypothetical protein Vretimale_729 [Volvox reticuliferus]|uniref:ABC transporter n=1 Tax=Volvox reticuliferus TaxID=1737510 RepID=A0A8J4FP17_9CHLO|nr:hypothetical protein Vretifemale_10562 [Volvox reticuliferus]GIL94771.1 hypothetical protein Vretimale_729 [Volvox reticuliferus]